MKEKNKLKVNNNKYPLPKIKYTNSNNQPLKRHKPNSNQQQLNMNNLYNLDQYDNIQSKEQKQKDEYIYNSKTNIKINNHRFNSGKLSESKSNTPQNNLKYLLREFGLSEYSRKLNELGYDNNNYLQIGYLSRKSFNNLLSRIHIFPGHIAKMEKFYEYLRKINISSNYDYNHYMNSNYNNYNNSNTNSNTNSISSQTKIRRTNYNSIYSSNSNKQPPSASNNYNHYYNYDNYNINKQQPVNNQKHKKYSSPKSRPKTSQSKGLSKPKSRIRNNFSGNKLMKRNMENNYQLNSPFSNNINENNKNTMNKEYLTNNKRYISNNKINYDNNYYLELKNRYLQMNYNNMNDNQSNLYDSNNNYYADKQKELEDKINNNIEKMLNYYMAQLNDKLDRSYETVEDSSLSYVITSQINESQSLSDKNSGSKILPNYKLPSMNNFDSLNNKKNAGLNNNNKNNEKLRNKFNDKNKNSIKKEEEYKIKSENNNKIEKKVQKEERKDDDAHMKEKEVQKNNINEEKNENENRELIIKLKDEEKKEIINENKMHKDIIKVKDEYVKEIIKKHSDQETSTKSKDSKEHDIEEDEFISKDKKQIPTQIQTPTQTQIQNQPQAQVQTKEQTQDIPIDIKLEPQENEKEEEKKVINKNHRSLLLNDSNIISDRYSLEQNIFDSLRLNRSLDEENINKDTLKFDIEFMCRCLGLALMRIIEQGKEKQHITELYTSNEKDNQVLNFKFYNSDFNKSINLLKDFFNTNNNEKLGEMNMISILEKFCLEHEDIDNDDIDMMKHIIKNGDEKIIQKDDLQEETFKLKNGLADIENEIKFIGEFFSYGKKKKNYQNLSENTKKILCKDLSYIKEIDSELNKTGSNMNSKINNNNNSGINNSNINNVENYSEEFNMSKTSKEDKEEDSKSNQENKNKILGEDEKDEDEDYNYEDEFLNDENDILDEKKEKENEKEKGKEDINNDKENNIKKDDVKDEDKKEEEKEKEKDDEKLKIEEIKDEIKNEKIKEELSKKVNEKDEENIIKKEEISTNTDLNDANGDKITSKENMEIDKNISDIKNDDSINESNNVETNYIIDADNMEKFKDYLLKQFEIFDDDFLYYSMHIPQKRYMPPPDPQSIFEFVANIMILTKMEKEVIIISLIYIERLIFNTGFIINSRNWRKIIFIALIIASKLWDDDSLENIHFSQVFTHLKIGEINLLERTFLELINYKVFIKFGEYMKYYLAIKNLALRFNFNGEQIVPVSVQKMMKIQEYAYQMQKRMRKKVSLNNSAQF